MLWVFREFLREVWIMALLNNQIDLAVHSMKDVPVQLPDGLMEAAVLERDNPFDLLVPHPPSNNIDLDHHESGTIASSSLRRKAQWLHRFPEDQIEPIRGNVNTRLKKLETATGGEPFLLQPDWNASDLRPANAIELHWMIPAPAQGAIWLFAGKKIWIFSNNAGKYIMKQRLFV